MMEARSRMKKLCVFMLMPVLVTVAGATDVSFTAKPKAEKTGDGAKITFAVAGQTDVEVAILDGTNVVRHLAAGVLGGAKPPPEPLKAGLTQEVVWDGRDDFGKPVAGNSFKVRVRAGVGVKFGRLIGDDPYAFGEMDSMASDEDGNLYILGHDGGQGQRAKNLRVFDPEGRYLRTLMPFPADLPPTAMKELATWDESRQAFHLRVQSASNPEIYNNGGGQRPRQMHIFAASKQNGVCLSDGYVIWRLDAANGAILGSSLAQAMWAGGMNPPITAMQQSDNGMAYVTASPDGKYVYFSGPFSNAQRGNDPKFPPGCVYRMKIGAGETMQLFKTLPVTGAYSKKVQHFTRPHGPVHQVAVDAKGNVYVADRDNDRIAIFDEAGKETGEIPVQNPHLVAVHPRTGAVYVIQWNCIGYHQYQCVLLKFGQADKSAQPVARYDFSKTTEWPALTLVASKDKTVVWLGSSTALEDDSVTFKPVKTAFVGQSNPMWRYSRMAVDYGRDEVYIQDGFNLLARFDGRTGQGGMLQKGGKNFNVVDMAMGYDGLLYMQPGPTFSAPLARLTRELEPAPFSGIGTHVLMKDVYGRMGIGNCQKGIGVGPDGSSYVCFMYKWVGYWVTGFGPDGKPLSGAYMKDKNPASGPGGAIIGPIPMENGGLKVDLQGNIYLGVRALPSGFTPPKGYEGDKNYTAIVGSVFKFSREGGTFVGRMPDLSDGDAALPAGLKSLDADHVAKGPVKVAGALNVYPGLAPFSGAGAPQPGAHPQCVCRVPRFDVDRYGRLALPNSVTCSVLLYDNAGNQIMEFGKYGNFDSQYVNPNTSEGKAGKPTVSVPEIPLAWPTCAGFSENSIYALDTYNRRAVRTDLTYKAEELCDVK